MLIHCRRFLPGSWAARPRHEEKADHLRRFCRTAAPRRSPPARAKSVKKADFSTQRLLHELEVHRIELEMQNAELQKTRDELEVSLEKITDLYDFAPVGYFSIDESGVILEANLKSAALLGMERSRLINRSLLLFMSPAESPGLSGLPEKGIRRRPRTRSVRRCF